MRGLKAHRMLDGHGRVAVAMEDEGRLREARIGIVAASVFEEFGVEGYFAAITMVKDKHGPVGSPLCNTLRAEHFDPQPAEIEGGCEQDEAGDFGVPGRIERGHIAPETGADEQRWLAIEQPFEQMKLASDCEARELAFGQIGNFQTEAQTSQPFGKKLSFARARAGGEAMEIQDTQTFEHHLHVRMQSGCDGARRTGRILDGLNTRHTRWFRSAFCSEVVSVR